MTFHPAAPDLGAAATLTIVEGSVELGTDITFVDTGEITGTVLTTGGQPVADAVVTASQQNGWRSRTTTTDVTGTYELELGAGNYTVSFSVPDGPTRFWDDASIREAASTLEVVDATSLFTDIDATFSIGRIAGTLSDAGEPASHRRLTLRSVTTEDVTAFTTASGDFDVRYLSAGTYELWGSAPVPEGEVSLGTFSIDTDGELIDLDVQYPTGAIAGTITRNGSILSAASGSIVTLTPTSGGDARLGTVTNGKITATYLPAGDYIVSFNDPISGATRYHPGVASDTAATVVAVGIGTVDNVDIELADTAIVGGTITSPSGSPVADAVVSAHPLGAGAYASARTDSDGRVRARTGRGHVPHLGRGTNRRLQRISLRQPVGHQRGRECTNVHHRRPHLRRQSAATSNCRPADSPEPSPSEFDRKPARRPERPMSSPEPRSPPHQAMTAHSRSRTSQRERTTSPSPCRIRPAKPSSCERRPTA